MTLRDDIKYRELLARAHRMAGQPAEAARVHEELLRIYAGHALSRYDLGHIYEEIGVFSQAQTSYRAFLNAWAEADSGLSQIEDTKRRLKKLGQMDRR
jgi:hypothetical protein